MVLEIGLIHTTSPAALLKALRSKQVPCVHGVRRCAGSVCWWLERQAWSAGVKGFNSEKFPGFLVTSTYSSSPCVIVVWTKGTQCSHCARGKKSLLEVIQRRRSLTRVCQTCALLYQAALRRKKKLQIRRIKFGGRMKDTAVSQRLVWAGRRTNESHEDPEEALQENKMASNVIYWVWFRNPELCQ